MTETIDDRDKVATIVAGDPSSKEHQWSLIWWCPECRLCRSQFFATWEGAELALEAKLGRDFPTGLMCGECRLRAATMILREALTGQSEEEE